MTFTTERQNFLQRDFSGPPTQCPDVLDGCIDLCLPTVGLGDKARDRLTMARNADGFTTLHLIKDLRQVSLGF
jgi:hypothetical protein